MIRPKRIAKGITNALLNNSSNFSTERLDICKICEHYQRGFCKVCGCLLTAKTKVIEENCPKNKFKNIMTYKEEGITLVNLSTDKGELRLEEKGFVFKYNPLSKNDSAEITFKLVNDRGSYFDKELNLNGLNMRSDCGCTIPSGYNKTLEEGANFDFKVGYNTSRLGAFSKNVRITGNNRFLFNLRIQGKVN